MIFDKYINTTYIEESVDSDVGKAHSRIEMNKKINNAKNRKLK